MGMHQLQNIAYLWKLDSFQKFSKEAPTK